MVVREEVEVQGGGWAVSHFIFIAFEADPRLEPIPPTSDRWSTNLVWNRRRTHVCHLPPQFEAEPQNWRGDLKIFVSWLLFGLHLISCYFVDSSILLWSGLMSTFQHFTHKYFFSQILLLPGQPWPTLLLGHMGRHIHFSFFKIKNIFESRNWWPFKAGQLGVIHSFVWYYRGRGGLKLRLIRTSFTWGPSGTQFRLNCLAFSLSNLLQHLDSDQVGIYASRNI